MNIIKQANDKFKQKKYSEAIHLYEKAGKIYGFNFLQANIGLCRKYLELNFKKTEVMANEKKSIIRIQNKNIEKSEIISNSVVGEEKGDVFEYINRSVGLFYKDNISFKELVVEKHPLVSIVMTSWNSAETLENSIYSLLHQTWPNLEIVVVDDNSSDRSLEILNEIKRRSGRAIRIISLNTNVGTYLAKNIGIQSSGGEIIMFQDSDDYSHPDRVLVQAKSLLLDAKSIANRTQYCRFESQTKKILPIGKDLSKFGLITLAVWRKAFKEIGYFDAVKRAGDDEWFERLRHFYESNSIKNLQVTLYAADFRPTSLAADLMTKEVDGSIKQTVSGQRKEYVELFKKRFKEINNKNWFQKSFPPLPKRALENYPDSLRTLSNITPPIYASICSIPKRSKSLYQVIERVLPQVDHIYVYLDKYPQIPDFLKNRKEITVLRSEDYDVDFRDNAKFIMFNDLKKRGHGFYYITLDDDLNYPREYVLTLINSIDQFDRKVIVGFHGVIYEENPVGYFEHRFIYHFIKAKLTQPKLVNNLGTGTVGFYSEIFDHLTPKLWPKGGMVDIFFSIEAKVKNIPMLCLPRIPKWLDELKGDFDSPTLYQEFKGKDDFIAKTLRGEAPWGYKSILETLDKAPVAISRKLKELLPLFANDISVRQTFNRIRG